MGGEREMYGERQEKREKPRESAGGGLVGLGENDKF